MSETVHEICKICLQSLAKDRYSKNQWRKYKKGSRTCINCTSEGGEEGQKITYPEFIEPGNFVPTAGKGCYIAHGNAKWLIGYEKFNLEDFGLTEGDALPDISIDPEDDMLSVINTSQDTQSYYITLGHTTLNKNNKPLETGITKDEKGNSKKCTSFVLVLKPGYMMDVCYIFMPKNGKLDLYSHISKLESHPEPKFFDKKHTYSIFPLGGDGPFICTQGIQGCFTHFTKETFHALDFKCPIGTPVLAVSNGKAIEINQTNTISGIHANNLFFWNSLMLQLDDGNFIEYVHVKPNSVIVKVGDQVKEGQKLCETGDTGFCPEPHLHIQMHTSKDPKAPTIMFAFQDKTGNLYFPIWKKI